MHGRGSRSGEVALREAHALCYGRSVVRLAVTLAPVEGRRPASAVRLTSGRGALRRAGAVVTVGVLAGLLAGCGSPAPTATAAAATASAAVLQSAAPSATVSASPSPADSPSASPSPSPSPPADLTQQPFTVLVLGADSGFRTDSIMVAGVDPVKKTVSILSLPRDTVNVPLPGAGVFRNRKVNEFYNYARENPGTYPQGPGRATADMMQRLLAIRIDYYAVTTFSGFNQLVDALGGVQITVPKKIVDPTYQLPTGKIGIVFKPGAQIMSGARAQVYARTRNMDTDFGRARRQQQILIAAGQQLLRNPALFASLLGVSSSLITDFPVAQVPALIKTIGSMPASSIHTGTVLGPSTYSHIATSCGCGYALDPNIAAMQKIAQKLIPWAALKR